MLAVARLHDAAFRIGEVILRFGIGRFTRWLGFATARFFAGVTLRLPRGHLGLMLGVLRDRDLLGAGFDHLARLL